MQNAQHRARDGWAWRVAPAAVVLVVMLAGCDAARSARAARCAAALRDAEGALDRVVHAVDAAWRGRAVRRAIEESAERPRERQDEPDALGERVADGLRAHSRVLALLRSAFEELASTREHGEASRLVARAGDALLAARASWRSGREPEGALAVGVVIAEGVGEAARARARTRLHRVAREVATLLDELDPQVLAAESLVVSEQRTTLGAMFHAGLLELQWPPDPLGLMATGNADAIAPGGGRHASPCAALAAWHAWCEEQSRSRLRAWRAAAASLHDALESDHGARP